MARTTVRLSDGLEARAKRRAASQKITFTQFVEEAIREKLAKSPSSRAKPKLSLPTFGDPRDRMTTEEFQRRIAAADLEGDLRKIGRLSDAGD